MSSVERMRALPSGLHREASGPRQVKALHPLWRWQWTACRAALPILLIAAAACGGGSPSSPNTHGDKGLVTVCFYDAAETSYNLAGNPDVATRRVAATGLTLDGTNLGSAHCAGVTIPATVTVGGSGFLSVSFNPGFLDHYVYFDDANYSYFYFVVPADLQAKGLLQYVEQAGVFRGWGPGSQIQYRALEAGDVAALDERSREVWQQLQPIDLDPYNGDGSIVRADPSAQAGTGKVVLRAGAWSFDGLGPVLWGGELGYRSAAPDFDERLLHGLAQSIGQRRNHPNPATGFGRLGAQSFTQDEIRALRVATNLAGQPVPP